MKHPDTSDENIPHGDDIGTAPGLGTKAAYGLIWTFGEKILASGVGFTVSLLLARLLTTKAYGIVAVTAVFVNISNALVEGGFGSALIQKKDADELDFHTVFIFEMILSMAVYLLLSVSSGRIAAFYEEPEIVPILKVLGLSLFLGSMKNVQHAYVSRHMDFRLFFRASLGGTVLSGIAGVVMAYRGFGVWALVTQNLLNSLMDSVLLFFRIRWKPKLEFSFRRLKKLYVYGWKICAAGLLSTVYDNLYGLVIGKVCSRELLALFSKGNAFPALVTNNISGPINAVTFPALASCQEDRMRLKEMTRKTLMVTSYLLWPVLLGMTAAAAPMVELLLTRKWAGCVAFLQISALSGLCWPVSAANGQLINAVGRSDISLRLDLMKKAAGLAFLGITLPFGIVPLALGKAAGQLFAAVCDAFPNRRLIGYGYTAQLRDLAPNMLAGLCLFAAMKLVSLLPLGPAPKLMLESATGIGVYILCSRLFKLEAFTYVLYQWKKIRRKQTAAGRERP